MKLRYAATLLALVLLSCNQDKTSVDLMVHNARVYTVDSDFSVVQGFVVKDGKVVDRGTADYLKGKYTAVEQFDADGKTIVPGLIDAHAHLYNLGNTRQQVELMGTTSVDEILEKIVDFQSEKQSDFILGRGWDQNDWEVREYPTKEALDTLFPDTPVALTRIDGHALWVNSKALEMAGVTSTTKMPGGEVVLKDGAPSGILIDSPMSLVKKIVPRPDEEFNRQALLDAEAICLSYGLTTINDAGLSREVIELIDKLQKEGKMKLRLYAMISNYPENLDHYLNTGIYKTDRLNVRSVKVYADGALGSRGAALKEPYSDLSGHYGAMITTREELDQLASRIAQAGYQMNTHAIGDSANVAVLKAYQQALDGKKDARWKVEHAQIVDINDFDYFSMNIIPSVQPTHATSDMYWAEDRVGPDRIKGAYAYKTLLQKAGILALGTDFPVEKVNPMYTFYAAVARKDLENYPEGGFRMQEALSRKEALKGMTIWAAYSNFEEDEKGSIETGKWADFTVLDQDLMTVDEQQLPAIKAQRTYIAGELVYPAENP
jgi:predicted amidohydrolase YtcJ